MTRSTGRIPPSNWKQVYDALERARQSLSAPVDSVGCDKLFDVNAPLQVKRYQILLSLMLSSQTRDQVTAAAMERLKSLNGGCTPTVIDHLPEIELASVLTPVSFYNNKAKYIKAATRVILTQHNGTVPSDFDALMALPGMGPKMTHLFVQAADGVVLGIGVDVHVHRICRRLRWVPEDSKTPEDTRKFLETWLPKEHWGRVNHMLVGFGQTVCAARRPRCEECPVATLCPSAFVECKRSRDLEDAGSESPRRGPASKKRATKP